MKNDYMQSLSLRRRAVTDAFLCTVSCALKRLLHAKYA